GDLTRLAQVVGNLLHNAIKYTPDGGHITVAAAAEGDGAVLRVSDDGTGISAEMVPQIFGLFTQVNRTLHRAQGGLGLGLSLSRNLVEMHGGTIEARSAGLGQGSTFTVRLPLGRHPSGRSRPAAGEPAVAVAPTPAAARRILVVDDNEDGAEMLALMLNRRGHETQTVYTGEDALAAVDAFAPDLVFLDLGLPGISGHEVARRLRRPPHQADRRRRRGRGARPLPRPRLTAPRLVTAGRRAGAATSRSARGPAPGGSGWRTRSGRTPGSPWRPSRARGGTSGARGDGGRR
ncbi:MAG: response regulator, partial [Myxococcales bacterium]